MDFSSPIPGCPGSRAALFPVLNRGHIKPIFTPGPPTWHPRQRPSGTHTDIIFILIHKVISLKRSINITTVSIAKRFYPRVACAGGTQAGVSPIAKVKDCAGRIQPPGQGNAADPP